MVLYFQLFMFRRGNIENMLDEDNEEVNQLNQGLSKHQEMGFTPVTKMLQSNEGT